MISTKNIGQLTTYVIVLLCFAYPISAIFSVILSVPSTPFNIAYRAVCVLLSLLIITLVLLRKEVSIKKTTIPLLGFLFVYLLRIVFDTLISPVFHDDSLTDIYAYYLGSIVLPVIAIIFGFKYCNPRMLTVLSLYTLVLSNVLLTIFYLKENGWTFTPEMLVQRALITGAGDEGLVVNPISYSLYGGYLLLFSAAILFLRKPVLSKVLRFIAIFGVVIGMFNLILGTSRGPLIFSILGLLILVSLALKRTKISVTNFVKIGLVTVVLGLIVTKFISSSEMEIGAFDRLTSLAENLKEGEKEDRNVLYQEAWDMFKKSPIVGNQFVLDSNGSYPHNVVLEVLMSVGLFGLFLYIMILTNLILSFINFNRKPTYMARFMILVTLSIGISLTSGNIYQSVDNWNLIAVLLAAQNSFNVT